MEKLIQLLRQKQLTIASVESITAGMFASSLAGVPNASAVLKGALVTYQTCIKEDVLHVDPKIVESYGVISKECVKAMAQQGQKMFHSDICVSFSGNAGPSVLDNKPVGMVHMALLIKDKLFHYEQIFNGDRNEIRKQSCEFMKKEIIMQLVKDNELIKHI